MRDTFLGFTVHVHHKGGNSQQEMNRANQVQQQQLAQQQNMFNQQMNYLQQYLGLQQGQLNMVNPVLQNIIQSGGMLPEQESAMRSAAMMQTGQGERNAIGAINQNLVARGISGGETGAGSGDIARNFGALEQGLQGQQAQDLMRIQMAKGQGLNQALGTALGVGGMYGSMATGLGGMFGQQGLGLGSEGINALGIGAQAGQAADQAQTGFWGSLVGGLAGLGGAGIGKIK